MAQIADQWAKCVQKIPIFPGKNSTSIEVEIEIEILTTKIAHTFMHFAHWSTIWAIGHFIGILSQKLPFRDPPENQ